MNTYMCVYLVVYVQNISARLQERSYLAVGQELKGDCSLYPCLHFQTLKSVHIVLLLIFKFYFKNIRTIRGGGQTEAWMPFLRQAAAVQLYALLVWRDAGLILTDLPFF